MKEWIDISNRYFTQIFSFVEIRSQFTLGQFFTVDCLDRILYRTMNAQYVSSSQNIEAFKSVNSKLLRRSNNSDVFGAASTVATCD